MAGPEPMQVEIAWPDGADYRVVHVALPAGATVRDAVAACASVPGDVSCGVFGQPVQADTPLSDGDRLEFYLPLRVDPKTARQRRAATAEKKSRAALKLSDTAPGLNLRDLCEVSPASPP